MEPSNQNDQLRVNSNRANPESIPETYSPNPIDDESVISNQNNQNESESKELIDGDNPVHWSAVEYIFRDKNKIWFLGFALVVFGFIALDIFLIKSYTFSFLVIVMAVSVVIYSHRPPREINYTLSGRQGLYVGEKLYHFEEFKSFGLLNEEGYNSIVLIPVKRFMPSVSVYFPQEAGEEIVDILGTRLPMEKVEFDIVDEIVRKLRI